jgi:hypothetical protein
MEEQEVKRIRGEVISDFTENIAPVLEETLQHFDEIRPGDGDNPPKFLQKLHTLIDKRTESWQLNPDPDKRKLIADTFNEYMDCWIAGFLHSNQKVAVKIEKAKNLKASAHPASIQQPAEITPVQQPAEVASAQQQPADVKIPSSTFSAAATPAAAAAKSVKEKDKGKGLKALQNVVKAGGAVLSAFFSYQPPKVVTDVSNLTEFALGVIFGTAKGTIQKLREESKLSQSLQNLKNEVTNGYLADIAPKLSKAFDRYDDILSTPGDHSLLMELNTSITDKIQKWTSGKTAEEQQFVSKTFSTLLHSQTAATLAKNPALAQRVDEDRTLLQAFGIPAEVIHPDFGYKPKEWTPALAEKLVKEDGNNLKSVPEQLVTEPLCKIAVSGENGKGAALEHVPEHFKTPELCDAAMRQDPAQAFLYVPDMAKTPEMCDKAVSAAGENLQRIPKDKMGKALCEKAVKSFNKGLANVPEELRDAALCLTAIKIDGTNLQYVPNNLKTKALCTEAQKCTTQDVSKFFPKEFAKVEKVRPSKALQAAIAQAPASAIAPKKQQKATLKMA